MPQKNDGEGVARPAPILSRVLAFLRGNELPLAMLAFGLLALTVELVFDPPVFEYLPPCPFRYVTGFHCPGCGSSRASYYLMHGDLARALASNPLMVLSLPFLAYHAIAVQVYRFTGRAWPGLLVSGTWMRIILGIILVYWVARNIPVYPFTLLAPH